MADDSLLYSASANGGRGAFFDPRICYPQGAVPADAVRVTAKRHAALITGQSAGYEIIPDIRGRPQLRSLSPATLAQARAACLHAIRREAARRIEQRMPLWRQINALRDSSDPGFHEIDLIRAASNLIEDQLGALTSIEAVAAFPAREHPLWPEFDRPTAKD